MNGAFFLGHSVRVYLNSHGGHSQLQLHTPGTRYRLTLDLVTLYTPLKTPQNTPV